MKPVDLVRVFLLVCVCVCMYACVCVGGHMRVCVGACVHCLRTRTRARVHVCAQYTIT